MAAIKARTDARKPPTKIAEIKKLIATSRPAKPAGGYQAVANAVTRTSPSNGRRDLFVNASNPPTRISRTTIKGKSE